MRKSFCAILVFAFAALPASAVEVATLFTAQVPLDAEAADPRSQAYRAALEQVLLRVSGAELVADPGMVESLFPDPSMYVVQFRPGSDDTLWVSFDGDALERVLRQSGQTVWDSDRPLTLVWVAVDWGQGRREIVGADDPEEGRDAARSIDRNRLLRQRILDTAERRGLPVIFPLLDAEDLRNVRFSDIWGGFDEALLAASARYDVNSILIGRVRPGTSQRNQWRYYLGGRPQTWSGEPEIAVGLVADEMAAEFAVSGSAPLESVLLTVAGIDNVAAYGSLQSLLAGLTIVEDFAITRVFGDEVLYRVEVRGGASRLGRALRFNGLIEREGIEGDPLEADALNSSLEFYFSP